MKYVNFNLYQKTWVFTSSAQVRGGPFLDRPPVRLIPCEDFDAVKAVISELLKEDVPVVPEPDWSKLDTKVGIRARALGLKSWSQFVRGSRTFDLILDGPKLVLEEWRKQGSSIVAADPLWKKVFDSQHLHHVVRYLFMKISKPNPIS